MPPLKGLISGGSFSAHLEEHYTIFQFTKPTLLEYCNKRIQGKQAGVSDSEAYVCSEALSLDFEPGESAYAAAMATRMKTAGATLHLCSAEVSNC